MRDENISLATIRVVSKFGIKKTTMADIADEANISRQTLYNAYPNKDAVLQASAKFLMFRDLNEVETSWQNLGTLEEKLESFFRIGPITWYDIIQATPDAAEMIEGFSKTIEPALNQAHSAWVDALTNLLTPEVGEKKAADLADFVFIAAKNAKYSAENRQQLLRRLAMLKEMVLGTYT